jgi:hypothetical protein
MRFNVDPLGFHTTKLVTDQECGMASSRISTVQICTHVTSDFRGSDGAGPSQITQTQAHVRRVTTVRVPLSLISR